MDTMTMLEMYHKAIMKIIARMDDRYTPSDCDYVIAILNQLNDDLLSVQRRKL